MPRSEDGSPVEVPADLLDRVRALCTALPEVTVRVDGSRTGARSTAWSFDVRGRSFCLLVARRGAAGGAVPLVVVRVRPGERAALLASGHPFAASRAGADRVVVTPTEPPDWTELGELVTESYRILAPKKLAALLPRPAAP